MWWRAEADKQGRYSVTPIREDVREALDQYLRENPRVGRAPRFPSPRDETRPVRRDLESVFDDLVR